MKKKMPSEGLRLGRDSGSILCDTLKKWRFRTGWGGYSHISVLYVHLQKRRMLIKDGVADDQFLIVPPNKFIPYQEIDDVTLMKLGRKIWIYPQYFIIRYRNLLRKLKKFLHK